MHRCVIAIVGPTAVGKTKLVFSLAQRWPIEVISMDSAQVYQGMDIGTDKPTESEKKRLTHHLIDIIKPTESFSVAQFLTRTKNILPEIWSRQSIPVLVGGTFLYLKALREGIHNLPESSPEIRAWLEEEAQKKGWPALYEKLKKIDPDWAEKISPHDTQRIQRALEVYELSQKTMTSLLKKETQNTPLKNTPLFLLGLTLENRTPIRQKIAERFHSMLSKGLLDELRQLKKSYDLHEHLSSMRCIGYRQAWQYLNQKISYSDFVQTSITATHQLAKRQLTWIKKTECNLLLRPYEEEHIEDKAHRALDHYLSAIKPQ